MRYPYYSPNLEFSVAFRALFQGTQKASSSIEKYFANLTGKKYIIITNSCRTALYLAYRSLDKTGEVITSPLTCKVAIDPIDESGNKPIFADINTGDLNINVKDIEHRITKDTIAVQTIHFGGNSCAMHEISRIARKYGLCVVEDCAQALGAKYHGNYTGSFGDIACFSLVKNAYGIGGGIFATDSEKFFRNALIILNSYTRAPFKLTVFRFFRNIAETYRRKVFGDLIYKLFMKLRGHRAGYISVKQQLHYISSLQLKIAATQIRRIQQLHYKRKRTGVNYYYELNKRRIPVNSNYNSSESSFTKFYIYNPKLNIKPMLLSLNQYGIECMHLEQRHGQKIQKRLISKKYSKLHCLPNYDLIHDHIISIPLFEGYNQRDINYIISAIVEELK